MATDERERELLAQFRDTPIFKTFGIQLEFVGGKPIVSLPYNPDLDQGMGIPHGGVYATVLDATGWVVSAASRDRSVPIVTTDISIHFLKAARESSLRAEGVLLKGGERQDVVNISVYDDSACLVGHATGTYVVLAGGARKLPSVRGAHPSHF